ncbi:hypothetical protein [Thalassospira povalilytica]|uniref:hypothetical protein n=1 Tax=Thalassospira povalilytica TaxID=732237 RepID=UPI001D184534|nr:hypothetical protein [Thalassospira povalilytica]MCC4240331.1 hypothetical protein [Thalassospira povalilytica]
MRKAVVPYRYVSAHDIGAEVRTDEHWHSLTHCSGKLTKEDIEKMAEAHFNSRQHHIKEFSGFDGPKWSDVDQDTQELGRLDMIAAVKIAGIEVED